MKKNLVLVALVLIFMVLGSKCLRAQETAMTTVNIRLADVISIDAASAARNGEVYLRYMTSSDYHTSQNATIPNSLIITSSREFDINVKPGGGSFTGAGSEIPVDVLTITAMGGTMNGQKRSIKLKDKNQTLVKKAPMGSKLTLDLDYKIAAKESTKKIMGKPNGIYAQTVTYTATAS
ncbi:MAG: peptidoglycan-binding protein LysM [Arenibacter latericius]|nr:peptidoglycan-binding protein LysM [Arenibacter latericius]